MSHVSLFSHIDKVTRWLLWWKKVRCFSDKNRGVRAKIKRKRCSKFRFSQVGPGRRHIGCNIYRVTHDLLASSHNFLGSAHDLFIVSHRLLVRVHKFLVSSDRISIQLNQKILGNGQNITGTHKKKYGNQPINRGKSCNTHSGVRVGRIVHQMLSNFKN